MSAVNNAQAAINKVLAELEIETGAMVESISLDRIDHTCLSDDRQRFVTSVVIELKRQPGHDWAPQ